MAQANLAWKVQVSALPSRVVLLLLWLLLLLQANHKSNTNIFLRLAGFMVHSPATADFSARFEFQFGLRRRRD